MWLLSKLFGILISKNGKNWKEVKVSKENSEDLLLADHGYGARFGYGLVSFKGKLILWGGSGIRNFPGSRESLKFNDVWASENGKDWTLLVESKFDEEYLQKSHYRHLERTHYDSFPARSHFYYTVFRDHIFMIGGRDTEGKWLPEVWVSPNGSDWHLLAKMEQQEAENETENERN
jgi:hypothetical protein